MSKNFNLAADVNSGNLRMSNTAGQTSRKTGVSKEKQAYAAAMQSHKMRQIAVGQGQGSLTRPSPVGQKKVNNVVKNIDSLANSSKKPKTGTTGARGGNFASLLHANQAVSGKATHRNQQNKMLAQLQAQGKTGGKSSTRLQYGQKGAGGAGKMLFSPQPPQQNTRVKFHKPALDLFRKSSQIREDEIEKRNNDRSIARQQQRQRAQQAGHDDGRRGGYALLDPAAFNSPPTGTLSLSTKHGNARLAKLGPNVQSQRQFNKNEGQGGDNFSFVDKNGVVQSSFSPPPIPNGALLGEQRNMKQLLQGHCSEQRLQGVMQNSGQSSAAQLTLLDPLTIMQQNFFTPPEDQARDSEQRYVHYPMSLNQAQSAKELGITGNLALQRELQKDQVTYSGFQGSFNPSGQQPKGFKSSCELGAAGQQKRNQSLQRKGTNTSSNRRTPVKHPGQPASLAKTASTAQIEQMAKGSASNRTRIQKAPPTASQLPSARLFSQEKGQSPSANNVIASSVQIVNNALSQSSQRDNRAAVNRRGDLLKSGVNRRMEGINHGPFRTNNFEITNIKNYEDLMNINSLDGEERTADRQGNQDTEGDFISEGEQSRRTHMMGQYQANYMRNTISRENQIGSKTAADFSKGTIQNVRAGVGSDGYLSPASMTDAQPFQDYKRNKSVYKSAVTNQPAHGGLKKVLNEGKNGSGTKQLGHSGQLNSNFSVLSFDNVMRMKNLGNFASSQQALLAGNGGSSQQRLLSAHSSSQQQLNAMTVHRRDRSQRIHARATNHNDRDEGITGTDANDTALMSFRCAGDVTSSGREGPKTENNQQDRSHQMHSPETQHRSGYDIDIYSKKLLPPGTESGQGSQLNTHRQAGISPSAVGFDMEVGTQRAPVLVPNESNMFKKKFATGYQNQNSARPGAAGLAAPNLGKGQPNFIKMNIKRAGLSRDKYAQKAGKDKNFDSIGSGTTQEPAGRALLSPKTYKEAPKLHGLNSIGSIGSIGSPGSLSSQHLLAGKKTLKKVRSKEVNNSHNLHGQTGTTGGTAVHGTGTTGGTSTVSYRQLGNTLKTFRENYAALQPKVGSPTSADRRGKNLVQSAATGGVSMSSLQLQSLSNLKKEILKTHRAIQLGIQNPLDRNTTTNPDSSREQTIHKSATTKNSTVRTAQPPGKTMHDFLTTMPQTQTKESLRQQASPHKSKPIPLDQIKKYNSKKEFSEYLVKNDSGVSQRFLDENHLKHQSSANNISKQLTPSSQQRLTGTQAVISVLGSQPLSDNKTGGSSKVDLAEHLRDGAAAASNNSMSHATSTSGIQNNRSRVKPQADCQFIQQMLSDQYDGVNILDFDGVNEVLDANGNLSEAPDPRTRRSEVSGERSKERKRGQVQQLSNAHTGTQSSTKPSKKAVDKLKNEKQQAAEMNANHLRQQLDQNVFQFEQSNQGSSIPNKSGNEDFAVPLAAEIEKKLEKKGDKQVQSKNHAPSHSNVQPPTKQKHRLLPEEPRNPLRFQEAENQQVTYPPSQRDGARSPDSAARPSAAPVAHSRIKKRNAQELDDTTEHERFSNNVNNSRYQTEVNMVHSSRMNDSQMTTQTELQRYQAFGQNVTASGMIQSTIYHIRQFGQNIHDPEEKEKYYSDDFLVNQRHVNDKVEQELEEFKIEINEKVEQNATKDYKFLRMGQEDMFMNAAETHQINQKYHQMSQSRRHSGYQDYPESATKIRASNGNIIDLDGEAPFIGLEDKIDRYLEGNTNRQHPMDYTEVDPNNPRSSKGAARNIKYATNQSKKQMQQNAGQSDKYMQFSREFADQSMTDSLINFRKESSQGDSYTYQKLYKK